MIKKLFTVRKVLTLLLLLSAAFAGYGAYYKITYWGFDFRPNRTAKVWNIDARVSFVPTGEPVKVSLAVPSAKRNFRILNEDVRAQGYEVRKDARNGRIEFTSGPQEKEQNIYYRLTVYDNEEKRGKLTDEKIPPLEKPVYDERQKQTAEEILAEAENFEGIWPQKIIGIFNKEPLSPAVNAFLPVKVNQKQRAEKMIELLALKSIPARLVHGVRLEEGKQAAEADLMLEAYDGRKWRLFDMNTGKPGLPENFIIFQRGNASLLDVAGGRESKVRFSALRSVISSFKLAGHRAQAEGYRRMFDYSIYGLPLLEQNALKWLTVFPLGILIVVLMRNVVGIKTMGTFTPMLIAMSLVKTGFWAGLAGFSVIIAVGLLLRALLSHLNLLLVPRISSVVIFVILIIQILTVAGYRTGWEFASSAVFFPIIITAWIIERASITWEEDGASNALSEIFYSMVTAAVTYLVISSEYIRHITFAFNEINLVILFAVMLLGTYTGYRLTELKRFSSLAKGR